MTYRFPAVLCSRFSFRLSVRQVVSRVILRGSPLRYTTQCPIWAHFLNLTSVQFRDGALHRLDGTILIDTLNVHGNDLAGIHRFSMPMACGYRKRALILAYQRPLSMSVFDCFDFAPCLHHEKH